MADVIMTTFTKRGMVSSEGRYVPLGGFGQTALMMSTTDILKTVAIPVAAVGGALALAYILIRSMRKSRRVSGMGAGFGMTPQQAKFKAAALTCKGRPGYRACMKRTLRGR